MAENGYQKADYLNLRVIVSIIMVSLMCQVLPLPGQVLSGQPLPSPGQLLSGQLSPPPGQVLSGQPLPGFRASGQYDEQQLVEENFFPGIRVLVNAPLRGFGPDDRVLLILYALPNGSTIEETFGRSVTHEDEWRYGIQHIGAQSRFLRRVITDRTVVVAFLENSLRSWPAWSAGAASPSEECRMMVDRLTALFAPWQPEVVLSGHSGGGRFIFNYLNSRDEISSDIVRVTFLDSSYGYDDTLHGEKIVRWLQGDERRSLCCLAYNDSIVIYNGRPLVSPTGGTWYRSRLMKERLAHSFPLSRRESDSLIRYLSADHRIAFIFKTNPEGKIYHTTQVEYNGLIHSVLSGTQHEEASYRYYGLRAYDNLITPSVRLPLRRLNIPDRSPEAESGSQFMERISLLTREEREEEIFRAAAGGNIPLFLRETVALEEQLTDGEGVIHTLEYEVMSDYLSIGSDDDFCRIPMTPCTAQRLAQLFGASLLTRRLSDHIWEKSEIRLEPFSYYPVGDANEQVSKFAEHNAQIERQLAEAGGRHGALIAGIKKDVVIAPRLAGRPDRVIIYGWHRSDGSPIQPLYSGHIWWYVDYSHGIRLMNNQVLLDGEPRLMSDLLSDPLLSPMLSGEEEPFLMVTYPCPG